ncbi:hypothetical protein CN692_07750 [Bacillus sp. AFS002410]|uniref:ImmA/IrrE family metallo-endopeptidase n=1 Tax=Bacillus sp. AFS002410 TaxID=2033481 RepID=UPI000BF1567B|nr:ImmA/IrrE family metallo-endopeptidase [Bacillus sp. AFS002410]PEJ58169.1 hypothetical protein CN692_07750 [Bacillus sp. AFS002410]
MTVRFQKVRYPFVNNKVKMFLAANAITSPPVNVKELLDKNFRVKYTDVVAEGAAIWVPQKKKHLVLINPNNNYRPRNNFTYAHELGHILLNHLIDHNIDQLTEKQHYLLEKEANAFAAELLMPYEWIKTYATPPLSRQKVNGLKKVFGVSRFALRNRLINTKIITLEESKFLFPEIALNDCNDVNDITEEVTYEEMIEFPEIDKNMRFIKCTCGNEDFSENASYCKKCATYLYNECLNINNNFGCGQKNVGDALYCEYCGHQTMIGKKMEEESANNNNYDSWNPFEAEKINGPYSL